MSIRRKLFLIITVALVTNLSVSHYAALRYKRANQEAAEILERTSRIVTNAYSVQVHFKKQVQEWKNILLRGHEPEMLQQYTQWMDWK